MNTSASPERTDLSGEQQPLKSRRFKPGWFLVSPSVALLLVWMIVPLGMTIYFSLIRYNLLYPGENEFVGLENFQYFVTDSGFLPGAGNTLLLVGSVLAISVILGVLISALLEASEFFGRGIVRVLLISPFFIMPTVSALIWKNLIFHPVSGVLLMPICKGGLASTALLSLILCWNEAFWSLNLTSSAAAPLTALIASYSSPEGLFWAKLSAVSTLDRKSVV